MNIFFNDFIDLSPFTIKFLTQMGFIFCGRVWAREPSSFALHGWPVVPAPFVVSFLRVVSLNLEWVMSLSHQGDFANCTHSCSDNGILNRCVCVWVLLKNTPADSDFSALPLELPPQWGNILHTHGLHGSTRQNSPSALCRGTWKPSRGQIWHCCLVLNTFLCLHLEDIRSDQQVYPRSGEAGVMKHTPCRTKGVTVLVFPGQFFFFNFNF